MTSSNIKSNTLNSPSPFNDDVIIKHFYFYFFRYFQRKEEECEPAKVTLQISSKGIKLVAEALRHFVPSHAVTYVCQGSPPDDDIVSVILLLYNPVTKCPVHLHSYRCDSVETADLLAEQFQLLVDLPENQRKIRDLEERLHSQGLYPALGHQSNRMLIKSCDTGLGGSSGDLLTGDSSSEDHEHQQQQQQQQQNLQHHRHQSDNNTTRGDQERIARLYDSLAAELRDKLGGAMSGKSAPILLPPKDYETEPKPARLPAPAVRQFNSNNKNNSNNAITSSTKPQQLTADNGSSSSGLSSGIGSDLDDPVALERSKNREWLRSVQQHQQKRYSYHEPLTVQQAPLPQYQPEPPVRRRAAHNITRQLSERRDTTMMHLSNRRSMSDLRHYQQQEEMAKASAQQALMMRRRELDVRGAGNSRAYDYLQPTTTSRVKEALSKFESHSNNNNNNSMEHQSGTRVSSSSRSRSFREEQPQIYAPSGGIKYRRHPSMSSSNNPSYHELDQRERFPGLDRDSARLIDSQHHHHQHLLQRHKSSEFVSSSSSANVNKRNSIAVNEAGSVIVVEPTQKVGNRHFRAVRQPN
jgi:hypothetical protein